MTTEQNAKQFWQPDPALIPPEALADLERATQLVICGQQDVEFARRIRLHAEKIGQEILAKHGVLNVAVDLVREGRDDE